MALSGRRLRTQNIHLRQFWYQALEAPASLSEPGEAGQTNKAFRPGSQLFPLFKQSRDQNVDWSEGQGNITRDAIIATNILWDRYFHHSWQFGTFLFSSTLLLLVELLSQHCSCPQWFGLQNHFPMSTVVTGQKAESAGGRVSPTTQPPTYLPLFTSVILPSRRAEVIAHNFANLSRINPAEVAHCVQHC